MGREERIRRLGLVTPSGAPLPRRTRKVALGYCFGTLHYPFIMSKDRLRERDVQFMARGEEPTVHYHIPQSGLYIDHNRNRVVEKFLETDAEWLLQIDTDVEFPPDIVETLLAIAGSEKKVLAASVPLGPPLPSSAWVMTDQPGVWSGVPSEKITPEGIQVHGIATAVAIVHREVFEAIADSEGQNWFFKTLVPRMTEEKSKLAWLNRGPVKDRQFVSVGEDLAFCMRATDAGYSIWCAKVPGLRHHKLLPMSHDYEDPVATERTGAAPAEVAAEG